MRYIDIIFVVAISILIIVFLAIIWRLLKGMILDISNIRLQLHRNKMNMEEEEIRVLSKANELSYVRPDSRGLLPILSHLLADSDMIEFAKKQYQTLLGGGHPQDISATPIGPTATKSPDKAPDFFSLWQNGQLPKDRILLGYNIIDNTPIEITFGDIKSSLFGGQTDSGKSTLVRLILIQAIMQGAKIAIIDPHAAAGEESLADSFYPLNHRMYLPIARTPEEQLKTISLVRTELEKRLSGASKDRTPIVLVTDETGALLGNPNTSKPLEELLLKISTESRKVFIYALCIGQNFNSQTIPTVVRNSFVSIFSTYSKASVARILSESAEFGKLAERLKVGECVWSKRGTMMILRIPNTTSIHVGMVAQTIRFAEDQDYVDAEFVPAKRDKDYGNLIVRNPLHESIPKPLHHDFIDYPESSGNVVDSSGNIYDDVVEFDEQKMRQIIRMLQMEKSTTEIICTVFNVDKKGNAFQLASREYRKYLAQIAKR